MEALILLSSFMKSGLKDKTEPDLENLVLRQQLAILMRNRPYARLKKGDRIFRACLSWFRPFSPMIGADHYGVKPFHLRDLLLRIHRILQRTAWYEVPGPRFAGIVVRNYNVNLEEPMGNGPLGELQLTVLEAELLELLTPGPNRVISRAGLPERVWGYQPDLETRTVDNSIARLRKYFEEDPDQPRRSISIRGRGHKFVF